MRGLTAPERRLLEELNALGYEESDVVGDEEQLLDLLTARGLVDKWVEDDGWDAGAVIWRINARGCLALQVCVA